jgi:hypothetical protein
MSRTYGARKKDTGETIYDSYPLQHLQELLCYEDLDEAREACKHYSITVKPMKVSSSSDPSGSKVIEFIFWRISDFKEPVHPEKGYNIPLQPRKMVRTIESKLRGTTRLGVCRGEVSGEGAALAASALVSGTSSVPHVNSDLLLSAEDKPSHQGLSGAISSDNYEVDLERAEKEARRKERVTKEAEIKKQSRLHKLEQERQQKEAEIQRLADLERKQQERIKEAKRKEQELEMKRRKEEEERRQEMEEARKREEQRIRLEAEQRHRQLEEEEARKQREFEERGRRQMEHIERERQEELAKKQRKAEIERERRRKEAEAARLERIARELEAKSLKEAEDKRRHKEWQDRLNSARKNLLFTRWRRRLSRGLELTQRSQTNLKLIDPTFSQDTLHLGASLQMAMSQHMRMTKEKGQLQSLTPRRIMENLLQFGTAKRFSLSDMALCEIESLPNFQYSRGDTIGDKLTLLQKIGVVVPSDGESRSISELVRLWVAGCLDSGKVIASSNGSSCEVRSVVALYRDTSECSDCDVVLEIVPPGQLKRPSSSTGHSVVLILDEKSGGSSSDLGNMANPSQVYASKLSTDGYQSALESACKKVVEIFIREAYIKINRVSMFQLAATAIIKSIWMPIPLEQNDEEAVVARSTSALFALAAEVEAQLSTNKGTWSAWPPREFTSSNGSTDKYFSDTESLPVNWMASLGGEKFEEEISLLLPAFNGTFRDVIRGLLSTDAPRYLQDECTSMASKRHFRGCLERVLLWRQGQVENDSRRFVYLPKGLLDMIMDGVIRRLTMQDSVDDVEYESVFHVIPGSSSLFAESVDSISNRSALTKVSGEDMDLLEVGIGSVDAAIEMAETRDQENMLALSHKRKKLEDRTLNLTQLFGSSPEEKRRRMSPTVDLVESAAFSSRLESLLHGETVDFQVGDISLSSILGNTATILPGNTVYLDT